MTDLGGRSEKAREPSDRPSPAWREHRADTSTRWSQYEPAPVNEAHDADEYERTVSCWTSRVQSRRHVGRAEPVIEKVTPGDAVMGHGAYV